MYICMYIYIYIYIFIYICQYKEKKYELISKLKKMI